MHRSHSRWASLTAGIGIVFSASCATRVEGPSPASPASAPTDVGVAGSLVIEQFLRAVNGNDLDSMARLFGTKDGPIASLYPKRQVDDRMFAIATILKHEDYAIQRQEVVPGRRDEAAEVIVRMRVGGQPVEVPYTLVWSSSNRSWLIEQIGLEKVTTRR